MANSWERVYDPVRENTITFGPVMSGRFNVFRAGFYLGFVETVDNGAYTSSFRAYSVTYPGVQQFHMQITPAIFRELITKYKTLEWTKIIEGIDAERRNFWDKP